MPRLDRTADVWVRNTTIGNEGHWVGERALGQGSFGITGRYRYVGPEPNPIPYDRVVLKQTKDFQGGSGGALYEGNILNEFNDDQCPHIVQILSGPDTDVGGNHLSGTGDTEEKRIETRLIDQGTVERFIMEYMEGGDLEGRQNSRIVRQGGAWDDTIEYELYSEYELWQTFLCLAKAVCAMDSGSEDFQRKWDQGRELCHFDIKPENIFVGVAQGSDQNGFVEHRDSPIIKIGDFGLAGFIPYPEYPEISEEALQVYPAWRDQAHRNEVRKAWWEANNKCGTFVVNPPEGGPGKLIWRHDREPYESDDGTRGTASNIWQIGWNMYLLATGQNIVDVPGEWPRFVPWSDRLKRGLTFGTKMEEIVNSKGAVYSKRLQIAIMECLMVEPPHRIGPQDLIREIEQVIAQTGDQQLFLLEHDRILLDIDEEITDDVRDLPAITPEWQQELQARQAAQKVRADHIRAERADRAQEEAEQERLHRERLERERMVKRLRGDIRNYFFYSLTSAATGKEHPRPNIDLPSSDFPEPGDQVDVDVELQDVERLLDSKGDDVTFLYALQDFIDDWVSNEDFPAPLDHPKIPPPLFYLFEKAWEEPENSYQLDNMLEKAIDRLLRIYPRPPPGGNLFPQPVDLQGNRFRRPGYSLRASIQRALGRLRHVPQPLPADKAPKVDKGKGKGNGDIGTRAGAGRNTIQQKKRELPPDPAVQAFFGTGSPVRVTKQQATGELPPFPPVVQAYFDLLPSHHPHRADLLQLQRGLRGRKYAAGTLYYKMKTLQKETGAAGGHVTRPVVAGPSGTLPSASAERQPAGTSHHGTGVGARGSGGPLDAIRRFGPPGGRTVRPGALGLRGAPSGARRRLAPSGGVRKLPRGIVPRRVGLPRGPPDLPLNGPNAIYDIDNQPHYGTFGFENLSLLEQRIHRAHGRFGFESLNSLEQRVQQARAQGMRPQPTPRRPQPTPRGPAFRTSRVEKSRSKKSGLGGVIKNFLRAFRG